MDSLLASCPHHILEAWIRIIGWYKDAVYHPPPPDRVTIVTMTAEQVDLYRHVPHPVQPITVGLQPFPVDESILKDNYITCMVYKLCLNCSVAPLVIRTEHLRQCLIYATQDDTPDATNWHKVVAIMHAEFRDGTLAEESMWQTVVLIPKGASGDFRGGGLVGVLWKNITILLNRRITTAIKFHDVLHGFWAGRGMRTAKRFSWNSIRHMIPWIGTDDLRSLRRTGSAPGRSNSFGHTWIA